MVKRSIWRWFSVATVVTAGFQMGIAGAQDAPRQGQTPAPGEAEIQSQRTVILTGPEQLRESHRIIETVSTMRRRMSDMLDRARQERDIIKVNCLNDKLTQLDVTLRSVREHQDLLQTAVSLNNDGQRNHEYSLLTIFRQRSDTLEAEARQCIGEEAGSFGEGTTISVRISPNIPVSDTDPYPMTFTTPERPLQPSPIR